MTTVKFVIRFLRYLISACKAGFYSGIFSIVPVCPIIIIPCFQILHAVCQKLMGAAARSHCPYGQSAVNKRTYTDQTGQYCCFEPFLHFSFPLSLSFFVPYPLYNTDNIKSNIRSKAQCVRRMPFYLPWGDKIYFIVT